MFHEVGPDEQNARGPMEAVSDLGIQKVCCPQKNGGVVGQIKWTREHTRSSDITGT